MSERAILGGGKGLKPPYFKHMKVTVRDMTRFGITGDEAFAATFHDGKGGTKTFYGSSPEDATATLKANVTEWADGEPLTVDPSTGLIVLQSDHERYSVAAWPSVADTLTAALIVLGFIGGSILVGTLMATVIEGAGY